jgi:hypothetical protein
MRKTPRDPRPRIATVFESWSGWVAVYDGKQIAHAVTRAAAEAAAVARGYRTRALLKRSRQK